MVHKVVHMYQCNINRQLTAKQVEALTAQDEHSVGDGLLEIDAAGGKRWQLRYQLKGKQTILG